MRTEISFQGLESEPVGSPRKHTPAAQGTGGGKQEFHTSRSVELWLEGVRWLSQGWLAPAWRHTRPGSSAAPTGRVVGLFYGMARGFYVALFSRTAAGRGAFGAAVAAEITVAIQQALCFIPRGFL